MSNNMTTFWNFLKENTIEIPIIQRDYAQGRADKIYIRNSFLTNLKQAMDGNLPDDEKILKLDFVYGSVEQGNLNPLDGQQRLTTLWLLHWYVALKSNNLADAFSFLKKFTYETRITSREFCQQLCNPDNFKNYVEGSIVDYITSRTWFYSAWQQDPTIQSMLMMLRGTQETNKKGEDIVDGLEELFSKTTVEKYMDYWDKLTSEEAPIVFYYLPLQDFGLSDDLYIKMNARGKQLTNFENFKADLIGYIEQQARENDDWKQLLDPQKGLPIKLDTTWMDIFWKNKSSDCRVDEIYFSFLNRFFWNELFIAEDEQGKYVLDIGKGDETSTKENDNISYKYLNGESSSYSGLTPYKYFNNNIPITFFNKLGEILDNYSDIPECIWDTTFHFIPWYSDDGKVTTLTQPQRVVFFAICKYFSDGRYDETSLKRWMRVVWNLVSGEDESGRAEIRSTSAMRTAIEFIEKLNSHDVYRSLIDLNVSGNTAFDERCKEESAKAKQILNENGDLRKYPGQCKSTQGGTFKTWEDIIKEAENYAFFTGSIRFLYQDEKGEEKWDDFGTKWENSKAFFIPKIQSNDQCCLNDPYDNAELLKTLFSWFSEDNFWSVLHWCHRTFNNQYPSWRYYLLNKDIHKPIHNLLMREPAQEIVSSSGNEALNYIYQLSRTKLLDYVIKQIPYSWIRDYHYHKAIYPSSTGIFLNAFNRDKLLRGDGITISACYIVNDTDFLYGSDINFEYQESHFQWYRTDLVYLMDENWNYCEKDDNGKTEEEKYYCFNAEYIKDADEFKTKMNNLINDKKSTDQNS